MRFFISLNVMNVMILITTEGKIASCAPPPIRPLFPSFFFLRKFPETFPEIVLSPSEDEFERVLMTIFSVVLDGSLTEVCRKP